MRISTAMVFNRGTNAITSLQAQQTKTMGQLSSGQRMQAPSDDPVASARVVEIEQSSSVNSQFAENQKNAESSLAIVESSLGAIGETLSQISAVLVAAGNGAYNASDRRALATELRGRFSELMGMANSSDAMGNFLFGGYRANTTPFTGSVEIGVSYNGDDGQRASQVGKDRVLATTEAGSEVFMRVPEGNGSFVTEASSTNTGGGTISVGSVSGVLSLTGPVTLTFDQANNQFLVAGATPASGPLAFTAGSPVSLNGMSFGVSGTPANGDTFTVRPAASRSMFDTLASAIQALETAPATAQQTAQVNNELTQSASGLTNALDNVLRVRASVGVRRSEIDTLGTTSEDLNVQYQQVLSRLRDVDYARAISQLTQQQTSLQAAQMTFQKVTSMSLFNYL